MSQNGRKNTRLSLHVQLRSKVEEPGNEATHVCVCVVDGFVPRLCGRPRVAMMSQNGTTNVFHCAHTNSCMIAMAQPELF